MNHWVKLIRNFNQTYTVHDPTGLHGLPHILRAILVAGTMMRFHQQMCGTTFRADLVFTALSCHDLGRQAHGRDQWEEDSARICIEHLLQQGFDRTIAEEAGSWITLRNVTGPEHQIVHDADVLEILRLILPSEFDRDRCYLVNGRDTIDAASTFVKEKEFLFEQLSEYILSTAHDLPYQDQEMIKQPQQLWRWLWRHLDNTPALLPWSPEAIRSMIV